MILYIFTLLSIAGISLILLYPCVASLFHETDLWWMIPTISHIIKNNSFFGALKALFFYPHLTHSGEPLLNLFFFFIQSCFGFQAKYFILASMLIHFSSCTLLYFLIRKIGLNFYIAFLSALLYCTMFIHFHSYFWPMPFQHLLIVFFTFAVLNLYLKTNEYIDRDSRWKIYFWLTLFVNFLASFCPFAILILPALIFVHVLYCARDTQDRLKKYEIWLPLFITYLGNPLIRLCYAGSPVIGNYLHLDIQQANNVLILPLIFSLGIGVLFLFRRVLRLGNRNNYRKIFFSLLLVAVTLYLILYIIFSFKRGVLSPLHERRIFLVDFLSPYNFIRPFVGIFISFFAPFQIASAINSAIAYYYIPLEGGIIAISVSLLLIFIFIKKFLLRYKGLIIFVAVYILALRNMWMMDSIPSRYFIYITAVFALVFTSAFIYSYNIIMDKIKVKQNAKKIGLLLIFVPFCIMNILAIKTALLRSKLVNTFLIYDYVKFSEAIRSDINAYNFVKELGEKQIYIKGLLPMPFKEYWDFSPVDTLDFNTFRYTFAQVFAEDRILNVNINKRLDGWDEETLAYTVKNARIINSRGDDIEPFMKDFEYAKKNLKGGNYDAAEAPIQRAMRKRPFLLNYVLNGYKMEDLPWITGGKDLRTWINDIAGYYNSFQNVPVEKTMQVFKVLNDEIDSYIECLFYAAFLEYSSGRRETSNAVFSQIQFLDSDYRNVYSLLSRGPLVKSNKGISIFLHNTKGIGYTQARNKDSFFKFVLKVALNKDIFRGRESN